MTRSWIVVADSARARVFTRNNQHTQLEEIDNFIHPAGRLREVDQQTDRPGRSFDSFGVGRHAMEPHTDWKKKESEKFSRQLCSYLSEHTADFKDLTIVCPPEFMGLLRSHLDESIKDKVVQELTKNLVHLDKEANG